MSLEYPNHPPVVGLSEDGSSLIFSYFPKRNVLSYVKAHPDMTDKEKIQLVRIQIALLPIRSLLTASSVEPENLGIGCSQRSRS